MVGRLGPLGQVPPRLQVSRLMERAHCLLRLQPPVSVAQLVCPCSTAHLKSPAWMLLVLVAFMAFNTLSSM